MTGLYTRRIWQVSLARPAEKVGPGGGFQIDCQIRFNTVTIVTAQCWLPFARFSAGELSPAEGHTRPRIKSPHSTFCSFESSLSSHFGFRPKSNQNIGLRVLRLYLGTRVQRKSTVLSSTTKSCESFEDRLFFDPPPCPIDTISIVRGRIGFRWHSGHQEHFARRASFERAQGGVFAGAGAWSWISAVQYGKCGEGARGHEMPAARSERQGRFFWVIRHFNIFKRDFGSPVAGIERGPLGARSLACADSTEDCASRRTGAPAAPAADLGLS